MNYDPQHDDAILREVLSRSEHPSPGDDLHEAADFDELFGLFIDGNLEGSDREMFFARLDSDPSLRKLVANYVTGLPSTKSDEDSGLRPRIKKIEHTNSRDRSIGVLFVAASLMVAVGLLIWNLSDPLSEPNVYADARQSLEKSRFDDVRDLIEKAETKGVESPRLQNLMAQATLRIPHEISLTDRGTLIDFGFPPHLFGSRDLTAPAGEDVARFDKAEELLIEKNSGDATLNLNLNLGYIYLRRDEAAKAKVAFQQAIDERPDSFRAWLGHGLASYMEDAASDQQHSGLFKEAIRDFRRCLEISPDSNDARINLAMAISQRAGMGYATIKEALQAWKTVDLDDLNSIQREKIERAIRLLEHEANE